MIVATYLLTAHLLADFFLQTDWMAVNKSKRLDALLLHVAVYSLAMTMVTWNLTFGVVTFATHFAIDWVTSRLSRAQFPWTRVEEPFVLKRAGWPPLSHEDMTGLYIDYEGGSMKHWGMWLRRSRHNFFCTIGVDQWLHQVQLLVTYQWLAGN